MPDMRIPGQAEPEERPPFVAASEKRALPKAPPLAPNKRVGFAVVGLGRLSLEEIIPAFGTCKLAKLTALMTGDLSKGRRVAEQYGIPSEAVFAYDDWKGLAARDDVQVVYVVTPNGLHVEQVKRAAAAGKQVLCEKLMAANSAEAQEMIDACKKAGVPLMIAYRCQYEPHNAEVTRMVRSGEFGALKLIEAHNGQVQDTAMQWRHNRTLAGGGALPDIGIYCLSFARFVTGEEPEDIFAWSWSTPGDARFKDVEENVAWQMRFPSGVVARMACSYGVHEARPARLYFERAVVQLEPAFAYKGLRLKVIRRSPDREDVELTEERVMGETNQFATEIDHMAGCFITGRRPRTPGEEGLQDHKLMEAIYISAADNRPVRLERFAGLDKFRNP
ncbi:Gfo/Idh/MocA family protein [Bradyrhizobium sp. ma5]|uniref:Gfo/Idh/MocA family protein n=1 Tax=Bradyrhizobium sp. ma5 TaxID=3344828 RepID=UPI0035D4E73C